MTETEQYERFATFEDSHHNIFDDMKVDFTPKIVLSVTVLRCRDVSVSYIRDKLDTPDPQFIIKCPKLSAHNSFKTAAKTDSPTCEINETFQFVLPDDLLETDGTSEFPVEVELYDADILFDDFLGMQSVDVGNLKAGCTMQQTLSYGVHGEADLEFKKSFRNFPDIRLSLGLNENEKEFRKKRIPMVYRRMKGILEKDEQPKNILETPVLSLVCSGGGYRAAVGMCGAMEALSDHGLLDAFTYACGLSGSSWYLSSAYALQSVKSDKQADFHSKLRKNFQENVVTDFVNPVHLKEYSTYLKQKHKYNQPKSFVDLFGYTVGKKLLGSENIDRRLSDLQSYISDASVPFPLFVSLHVRNTVAVSKFHAYMEISPFEVALPSHGIALAPGVIGSALSGGFLARKCPELPLHFFQGMCGCAFSIMLNLFMEKGGENNEQLLQYIDNLRLKQKQFKDQEANHDEDAEVESDASGDSDDSDDSDEEDKSDLTGRNDAVDETNKSESSVNAMKPISAPQNLGFFAWILLMVQWMFGWGPTQVTETSAAKQATKNVPVDLVKEAPPKTGSIFSQMKSMKVLTSRDSLVGRTAKIFNIAQGFDSLKVFPLNPLNPHFAKETHIDVVGDMKIRTTRKISTKKEVISIADAGILNNVPTDVALRPQRTVDLMVVMDFNGYKSDTYFDYKPILTAAAHAWCHGLKFPVIDFKAIANSPAKEFLVFEGDEDDLECPTVLWFTLSNAKFRNLTDYKPRFSKDFTTGKSFNDFPVFDPGNAYSTFKFAYSVEDFDRLRDLMYYNVSQHVDEIKTAIAKSVERKRKRNSRE